jgi:phenylacetate-CoA ligase
MTVFQPDLETMPAARRSDLQWLRLEALLHRLQASGSAYWEGKLAGHDLASAVADRDLSRLPFTVKSELRDSYPFGMLAVPLEETIRIHASSGTRGKPTIVAYSAADIGVFAEVNARAIACAGGEPEDVLQVAYGYGLFTGGLGLHYGGERLGATVVPASGGNPALQLQLLADLGASGLACTPSFALLLAERAAADGMLDRIRLRYGVFGAEPWSEAFRAKLEEAWGGIDACDIYGLSEVMGPGVAQECIEGKGALHVFDDHFLPEVVDPASGAHVDPGAQGELALTTLTKEALPVIRYRTGDMTSFVDEPCPCGRTFRRIARFSGRVDDMLIVRGVNVFPSEIEAVVLDDPELAGQYAILVDRRGTMTELEVRTEVVSPEVDRGGVATRLEQRLLERLRVRVRVHVGDRGTVERQEAGKAKRVFEITNDEQARLAGWPGLRG